MKNVTIYVAVIGLSAIAVMVGWSLVEVANARLMFQNRLGNNKTNNNQQVYLRPSTAENLSKNDQVESGAFDESQTLQNVTLEEWPVISFSRESTLNQISLPPKQDREKSTWGGMLKNPHLEYENPHKTLGNLSIPNNVHFVFFSTKKEDFVHNFGSAGSGKPFSLINYLAVRAAYLRLQPDNIFFYCDIEPQGPFWDLTKAMVTIVYVSRIKNIFGNVINSVEHMSDVLRMRALMQHGGVYFDTDVISLKSFDTLRQSKPGFSMGKEEGKTNEGIAFTGLCNAVILGNPQSSFLFRWYSSYVTFDDREWSDHSVKLPWKLSRMLPDEIDVLDNRHFFWPLWTNEGLQTLFEDNAYDFGRNYAVHLWGKMSFHKYVQPLSFSRILNIDTSFHRMLRPLVPHPIFSALIYCNDQSKIDGIATSINAVVEQTFQLWEIVVVDSGKDAICSTGVIRDVYQKNNLLDADRFSILHATSQVNLPEVVAKALRGMWVLKMRLNEHLPKDLMEKAQNHLVTNPQSYFEEEEFSMFQFRESLKSRHSPEKVYPYRYGPFPELNPGSPAKYSINDNAFFGIHVLETKHKGYSDLVTEISTMKTLATALVQHASLKSSLDMKLRSFWPSKITPDVYRSIVFKGSEPTVSLNAIKTIELHAEAWQKAISSNRPVMVLGSNVHFNDNFDEVFVEAMNVLPLDFGIFFLTSHNADAQGTSIVKLLPDSLVPEAYMVSPGAARLLLDGLYPLEQTLRNHVGANCRKFNIALYGSVKGLVTLDRQTAGEESAPAEMISFNQVHELKVYSNKPWKNSVGEIPAAAGKVYDSSQNVKEVVWIDDKASEFDPLFKLESLKDPLADVKLLHLKLSILAHYGGIVLDEGFGSALLRKKSFPSFIAYFHDGNKEVFPSFPIMASDANNARIIEFRDAIGEVLKGAEDTDAKLKKALEAVFLFMEAKAVHIPKDREVVSFPVGILLE